MDIATTTTPSLDLFVRHLVNEVVTEVIDRIDFTKMRERKFSYSPDEVAELVSVFHNDLAVIREAKAGKLIGSKVRGSWTFTEEQIRDYLQSQEVTV